MQYLKKYTFQRGREPMVNFNNIIKFWMFSGVVKAATVGVMFVFHLH